MFNEIKLKNLERAYENINTFISNNEAINTLGEFFNFLFNLFSYRESYGILDKDLVHPKLKADSIYGALKCLYDIYKHKDLKVTETLSKLTIFVYSKKYPYSYPYTYGMGFVRFEDVNNQIASILQDKESQVQNFQLLYEKYLQGKQLKDILIQIMEEIKEEKSNG